MGCCLWCGKEEENMVDLRSRIVCSRLECCLEQDCDSGSRMTYMNRGLIGWEVLREGLAIGMDAGTHIRAFRHAFRKMNFSLIR